MKTIQLDPDRNLAYRDQKIHSHKNTSSWEIANLLARKHEQGQPIYEPEFLFGPDRIWPYEDFDIKIANSTKLLWDKLKSDFGVKVIRERDCEIFVFADFKHSQLENWLAIPELKAEAKFIWTTKSFPFYRSANDGYGILVNKDEYLVLSKSESETLELFLINMGFTINKSYIENVLGLRWEAVRLRVWNLQAKLQEFLRVDNIFSSLYNAYRLDFPILGDPLTVDFDNFVSTYTLWKSNGE